MRRVQRDKTHSLPDAHQEALDDFVLHFPMRGVPPPNEYVGIFQNVFGQSVLRILQRGCAHVELVVLGNAIGDGHVHSFRIDFVHKWVLAFMHVFTPDGDPKAFCHAVISRERQTTSMGRNGVLCRAEIAARCPYLSASIAGCRAILRMARSVNSRPGDSLCQGETPDGCGSGIKSNINPLRLTTNLRPITWSSLSNPMNCAIASRPTGITRWGRRMSNSLFIHDEQLRISSGAGTRSLPP